LEIVATWTGEQAHALRIAWRLTIEEFAGKLGIAARTVAKWEGDACFVPALAMQEILDSALEQTPAPVRLRFAVLRGPGGQPLPDGGSVLPQVAAQQGAANPATAIDAAAEDADTDHLTLAAEPGTGSLAWLWEESKQIARAANRPPVETFTAARRARYHALQLAGRTRRPDVLTDLHAMSGQATALMASTAFDLNHWDAAAKLARSAVDYAQLSGHASLQAWTLGLAALIANWRDEPDTALELYHRGLQISPRGTPRVRLRHIASRSYALLGDSAAVATVLREARHDQDDGVYQHDSLSEEIGGEFGFGSARAQACASAAWLDLGGGLQARDAAAQAVSELTNMPRARQPVSQLNGARIDLATACLLCGDRDQAEEALHDVFQLPKAARNISLAGRLNRTRRTLMSGRWTRDARARELAEIMGQWSVTDPSAQR
jgi:transcriptional regulator with XRE-family HTH domain